MKRRTVAVLLLMVLASPVVLWTYDSWFTSPRASHARSEFMQFAKPGVSLLELERRARDLDADTVKVASDVDERGLPRTRMLAAWKAYHLWPASYKCIVFIKTGTAERVDCNFDAM